MSRSSANYPIGKKKSYFQEAYQFLEKEKLAKAKKYLLGLSSENEQFDFLLNVRDNLNEQDNALERISRFFRKQKKELKNWETNTDKISGDLFNEGLSKAFKRNKVFFGKLIDFYDFKRKMGDYTFYEGENTNSKLIYPLPKTFEKKHSDRRSIIEYDIDFKDSFNRERFYKDHLEEQYNKSIVLQELSGYKDQISKFLPTLIIADNPGGRNSDYPERRSITKAYWEEHEEDLRSDAHSNTVIVENLRKKLKWLIVHISDRTIKTWIGLNN